MSIGDQFMLPNGYGPLVPDRIYFLLASQRRRSRVLLVWFVESKPGRVSNGQVARAYTISVGSELFENGLISGAIQRAGSQQRLPPWLSAGEAGLQRPANRSIAIARHIAYRLQRILPAAEHYERIIDSDDPIAAINAYARQARCNQLRFRAWFLIYVLFGCNEAALAPPFHRIGKWSRSTCEKNQHHHVSFGRPSHRQQARRAPRLTTDDEVKIVAGYRRRRELGKCRSKIYVETLLRDWGCSQARGVNGKFEFFHPEGKPFPTYRQFEYVLLKKIGIRQLQIDRRGPEWVRNRYEISRGSFTQNTANLWERVESDAYWSKCHPSDLAGHPLPRLVTVKLVDSLSGAIVGVGFNLGSEKAQAYRSAVFCAAIGPSPYAELFGLKTGDFDTPSPGIMAALIVDRGPGSGEGVADSATFRELTPTYSGQSKSLVEASHPREMGNAEAPAYPQSSLRPIALARQELWRAIAHNHMSSAVGRMTPEMAAANVAANPMGIWKFMEERCRTSATSISFESAVRTFLRPVTFKIDRNGIRVHHTRFSVPDVIRSKLTIQNVSELDGYVLPMCVRYAWIEWQGTLHQIDAQLAICDDDDQQFMSLIELQAHAARVNLAAADQQENRLAAGAHAFEEFERQTGQTYDKKARKKGRAGAKRTKLDLFRE